MLPTLEIPAPAPVKLSDKALLVDLNIRMPSFRKSARDLAADVAHQHGADAEMHVHTERLLAKDAIGPLENWRGRAKAEFYKRTSPWGQNGSYILASAGFNQFKQAMRDLFLEGDTLLAQFLLDYPTLREQARAKRGDRFDPNEYPLNIQNRFGWSIEYDEVPSGDWRVTNLSTTDLDELRQATADAINAKLQEVTREPYRRLATQLDHLVDRMQAYDGGREGRFTDSLIANIVEVIEALPGLNIAGDPTLDAYGAAILSKCCAFTPDELRKSEVLRDSVAEAAQAIRATMDQFV